MIVASLKHCCKKIGSSVLKSSQIFIKTQLMMLLAKFLNNWNLRNLRIKDSLKQFLIPKWLKFWHI